MAWRGAQPRSFRPELNAPGDSVAQRRFLAIELPPPARAALAEVQAALEGVAGLRWSDPEQAHVTLRFLGDLPTPTSELVERLLAESGPPRGVESLRLALGPVGTFGRRNPRVVWVGVEGPDRGALRALGERFAGHPALGSPATRPFLPHVTVGRARGGSSVSGLELSAAIEGFVVPRLAFEVHELVLFSSSHGRDAGPVRHEVEARVSLSSFAIGSAEPSPSPVLAEPLPEPTAGETRPLGPDEQSFRRYLRDYLAAASSRSLPSPLAASDLLWAARLSSELALPWPPSAALVEALFAEPSSADERARASRRLADQAEGAARRVRLGLDQARALLEDVADDGVAEQIVVSPADVTRWVERHGLPLSWLAEVARAHGATLADVGEPSRAAPTATELAPAVADEERWERAIEATWGEDARLLRFQARPGHVKLDLAVLRPPRLEELEAFERELRREGPPAFVVRSLPLGASRRRLELALGQSAWEATDELRRRWADLAASLGVEPGAAAAAVGGQTLALQTARATASAQREALHGLLTGRLETERLTSGQLVVFAASPCGEPALLHELLDTSLAGAADLACWCGPWEGRLHVALACSRQAQAEGRVAGSLLSEILAAFGGAGGGRPDRAAGSAPASSTPEALFSRLRAELAGE